MRLTTLLIAALMLPAAVAAQDGPIVVKADTVLDGKGGTLTNTAIVVQGSKIVRLDPNAQGTTYDLRGLTVMPGWIDTHAHIVQHFNRNTGKTPQRGEETAQQQAFYAAENAHMTLLGGFTTIQSPGAELDKDLRDAIAAGHLPGPRILTSLRAITDANAGTPDQIREFVRKAVADGADVIKIFATSSIREGGNQTLTDEQIKAACDAAHAAGKRAMVHAQGPEGAKAAILAGCNSIEHGNRLTDEVLDLMAQRKVYLDPNFGLLLHNYLENRDRFSGGNFNDAGFAFMEKGIPIGVDTFKRALTRNIPIVFGTDAVAGANGRNYEEFIYRVRDGGQKPMAAIVAATSTAAQSLDLGTTIGTIAPGFEADIIATDGNPLQDITAVRRVVFVMKGGKVYKNLATPRKATKSSSGDR